jgi:hypothetical protein
MRHRDLFDGQEMKAVMGLERGDVFKDQSGNVCQVDGFQTNMDVYLTDPTDNHPQSSRSGRWSVPIDELFEDWAENNIYPVELEASA